MTIVINHFGTPGTTLYAGIDPLVPAVLRLYNWQDPDTPVLVDSLTFDTDIAPLTFQDSRLSAEIGSVAIKQSTESIVYGTGGDAFEFGATLFRVDGSLNDEVADTPVYQVLVACKPSGRWATYPAEATFGPTTDSTFPPAFKITVETAGGTVLHTYEMRDGLAINDPRILPVRSATNALRPYFNCGMMLPWQSARLKLSSDMNVWFPGIDLTYFSENDAKDTFSANGAIPLVDGRNQSNSTLHWFATPRWPMEIPAVDPPQNDTALNAKDPNADTRIFNNTTYFTGAFGAAKAQISRAIGWDYEPASISAHDWYPGPGGPRFDRSFIPTTLALLASNPSYVRLRNNEPIRDMAEAWSMAYFNHPNHYVTDVKTLGMVPNDQIVGRAWSFSKAYYGSLSTYVSGGTTRHVALNCIPNQSGNPAPVDKDGRQYWNGWELDKEHNYCLPGWAVMLQNSPMHVVAEKHRFFANTMSWLGSGIDGGLFGQRDCAWRWLHYISQWICATTHPMGISRAEIEAMFVIDLESHYDRYYEPAMVSMATTPDAISFRNLGCTVGELKINVAGNGLAYRDTPSSLGAYAAGALLLMRRSGLWDVMLAKSTKCNDLLLWTIECFDKFYNDRIIDTNGRAMQPSRSSTTVDQAETPRILDSWAEWNTVYPAAGSESLFRGPAGAYDVDRADLSLGCQWPAIRRHYFGDINPTRRNIVEADVYVNAKLAEARAANASFPYRVPSHATIEAI